MNLEQKNITIIGLGLVGSSLGAALCKAGGWTVVGYDLDSSACRAALDKGYIDDWAQDVQQATRQADVIVLATPILSILDYLLQLKDLAPDGSMIIDMGSTKREICAAMGQLPSRVSAIGGHPMAGKKTSGVGGASKELFKGRKFILVENKRTTDHAIRLARKMIQDINAIAIIMDPDLHDRLVAIISHVPHFLSIPLLQLTDEIGDERLWVLAAGGYRNVVEHAVDNPKMWEEIASSNSDNIAEGLRRMAVNLDKLADTIESASNEDLKSVLHSFVELYQAKLD